MLPIVVANHHWHQRKKHSNSTDSAVSAGLGLRKVNFCCFLWFLCSLNGTIWNLERSGCAGCISDWLIIQGGDIFYAHLSTRLFLFNVMYTNPYFHVVYLCNLCPFTHDIAGTVLSYIQDYHGLSGQLTGNHMQNISIAPLSQAHHRCVRLLGQAAATKNHRNRARYLWHQVQGYRLDMAQLIIGIFFLHGNVQAKWSS